MLLTVVIVTKNPGPDIYKTLSSILSLNHNSVEVLIKDNSENASLKEINDFFQFSNFRFIHSPDEGIYDAMNQALEHARGEYVYFLNSGDTYVDCNVLSILKNLDPDIDFVYGNIISLHPYPRLISYSRYANKYSVYLRQICHQAIVFKKRVFEDLGHFDTNLKVKADHLFILQLIDQYRGKSINKLISIYKGGGFSYDYRKTEEEKKYLNNELKKIYSAPEFWVLSAASILVKGLVYLKNINKPV